MTALALVLLFVGLLLVWSAWSGVSPLDAIGEAVR